MMRSSVVQKCFAALGKIGNAHELSAVIGVSWEFDAKISSPLAQNANKIFAFFA
jgi:hypothetical protein